jgi:hypothetical protein
MTAVSIPVRPRISDIITSYPYPHTIAELVTLRTAQLKEQPGETRDCPHGHGPMQFRPLGQQPYEQLYCGLWWDCKNGCSSSGTRTSRDLAYDHGEPYNTGYGWEKFDGTSWVPVSDAEAAAFWASIQAWDEARQPLARPRPPRKHRSTRREGTPA